MSATNVQIGQQLSWGNPAYPKTGIVISVSQNGMILFVEHTNRMSHTLPKYVTIERREILHVVEIQEES